MRFPWRNHYKSNRVPIHRPQIRRQNSPAVLYSMVWDGGLGALLPTPEGSRYKANLLAVPAKTRTSTDDRWRVGWRLCRPYVAGILACADRHELPLGGKGRGSTGCTTLDSTATIGARQTRTARTCSVSLPCSLIRLRLPMARSSIPAFAPMHCVEITSIPSVAHNPSIQHVVEQTRAPCVVALQPCSRGGRVCPIATA